ncbi:MAG TPA: PLP-dependent aminotransferase family protein [Candidatus Acidoferrum sp.]|nr:PLP-dependent aminotransferase family protein [Candidatus Acidoferrum sp.]
MISFAGGLPSADSFPAFDMAQVPATLWQYGASEGESALREAICIELRQLNFDCTPEQVLVLSGSQQGIDLVAKLMIDTGTAVALESPTYLAALQVFRLFGARFVTLDIARPRPALDQASLCYVVPTFQNPTGGCYTHEQRKQLAQACEASGTVLFEDDPYRDLVYDACDRQPVATYLQSGSFIYQGSFSKTLAPGLRLGYLLASKDLVPYLTRLKQAADLHSNRLSQHLVLQALRDPARGERLQRLQQHYRAKRDAFTDALQWHMRGLANWQTPPGGLFFWLTLAERIDTQALLQQAIAQGVAFMPGEPFFHDGTSGLSHLRLNFSHASITDMDKGLRILRRLCEKALGIRQAG